MVTSRKSAASDMLVIGKSGPETTVSMKTERQAGVKEDMSNIPEKRALNTMLSVFL